MTRSRRICTWIGLWVNMILLFCSNAITGQIASRMQDLVTKLPGQPAVNFSHYAGYVNLSSNRALFYWFFEASSAKEHKPLLLWLNGGPGCSSVGYGATQEIGPFLVDRQDSSSNLTYNDYSWNTEANLLFVESPVGVGFSYSLNTSEYNELGDNIAANDMYRFLQNWFTDYPQYKSREFYIGGESYGGKYVPELADLILSRNKDAKGIKINLKGFLVGNPETHDGMDNKGLMEYAWSHAVVSDDTYEAATKFCNYSDENMWHNTNCSDAFDTMNANYGKIDIYSVFTPKCNSSQSSSSSRTFATFSRETTAAKRWTVLGYGAFDPCLDDFAEAYYNRRDVQKALHASDGRTLKNWTTCNLDIFNNWSESEYSVLPHYQNLIAADLRILVYSGDVDGRVPFISTKHSLALLNLTKSGEWRPWYNNQQVAGWVQEYKGLTYATVRGAGHDVPTFKPSEALVLFSSFLSGHPLPKA